MKDQEESRQGLHGQQLRERRENVGISQVELARLTGVNRGTIRNAENGMPLQARTLGRILLSLGCAAVVTHSEDVPLIPVLSSGTARTVAKMLLHIFSRGFKLENPADWEDEWREDYVLPYFRVIDAAAAARRDHPKKAGDQVLPVGFHDLRSTLSVELAPEELQQFDREMASWFGRSYPYAPEYPTSGLGRGLGALIPSREGVESSLYQEVQHIMDLDLPVSKQRLLLEHMRERRLQLTKEMNETLLRELAMLMDFVDKYGPTDRES